MVRQILDDFEVAAPWDVLYYPPQETPEFIAMESALLQVIDGIPGRVQALTASFADAALDEAARQTLDDAEFYFEGIHGNVAPDIAKLRSKVKALSVTAEAIVLTSDERAFTCEITADLKGKYTSSIMGAAASLIAEGQWSGVEVEPILFPEKAEEFERNDLLVETLSEVVENITNLLEEVPLAKLVPQWEAGQRADQYALTSLYSFLGNLGKLMREKSRRALYSGDYHQIQKRERLLSTRINELTSLHNLTWATDGEPRLPDGSSPFPLMILRATELAAILDVNILRKIIGEKLVKDLLFIVTMEKERDAKLGRTPRLDGDDPKRHSALRKSLPEHLHSLIPLLYDEDLQNFLGLLLGSVLKRASLALKRERRPAAAEVVETAAAEEPASIAAAPVEAPASPPAAAKSTVRDPHPVAPLEIDWSLLEEPASEPVVDEGYSAEGYSAEGYSAEGYSAEGYSAEVESDELLWSEPAAPPDSGPSAAEKLDSLRRLQELLRALLSRGNAHRKSFELVYRLLKQGKTIPPTMLQSMHPYLYDMLNMLIPQLHELDHISDISASHAANLIEYCTFLCDRHLSPEQLRHEVPTTMDRVLRLLDGLNAVTATLIKDLNADHAYR